MKKRIMAIALLLIFLLGLFLMVYAFLLTSGKTTLGMIGLGFVLSIGFLSYRLRREMELDEDYKGSPKDMEPEGSEMQEEMDEKK